MLDYKRKDWISCDGTAKLIRIARLSCGQLLLGIYTYVGGEVYGGVGGPAGIYTKMAGWVDL